MYKRQRNGQFVFIRQYRHGIQETSYELCAGVCEEEDGSPMVSAQRELLEETDVYKRQRLFNTSTAFATHNATAIGSVQTMAGTTSFLTRAIICSLSVSVIFIQI